MPWKELPPHILARLMDGDFIQGLLTFFGALFTSGVGHMARIADEVKKGHRDSIFGPELWLELPAWLMTALLTVGVSAYYELPGTVGAGLGVFFGYVGPKIVDVWLSKRGDK